MREENGQARMEEQREEIGVKEDLRRKLAKSRFKWAGHVNRMEEQLTKRSDAIKVEGRRRRGKPKL